jgi:hypothetical protein
MSDKLPKLTIGPNGFAWGPMSVTRVMSVNGYVALDIDTDTGNRVTVYVSPTGRSVRVFGAGGEWKRENK